MESKGETFDKCGPFQFYHAGFTQLTRMSIAWAMSLMMFGNYNPGWKCLQYKVPRNVSTSSTLMSLPQSGYHINQSINYDRPERANNSLDYSVIYNTIQMNDSDHCDSFHMCDVIEFNPSSVTIVSEFGLVCDKSFVPSIIISIQMVGMLVGSYVCGQLGELYGRKIVLYASTALSSLSCFLAIFSTSWQMYAAFNFFNGVGGGGIMVIYSLYCMEFLQPKWRAWLVGIPTYNVSLGFFVVTIFLLRDWRYIHIATAVLCGIACIGFLWSPESLRWLLIHGREKKAAEVIDKINRANKSKLDLASVKEQLLFLNNDDRRSSENNRKYTYLDLFRSRGMRSIVLKTSALWFFTIMSYYALTFSVKSLAGDFYINALIAGVSEIPAVLTVAPITNKLGRRMAVTIFMFVGTLSYLAVVVVYFTVSGGEAQFVTTYLAFIAKGSAVASVNALNVLSVELFPTAVRNVGMAFVNSVARLGAITAPYLIPRDQFSLVIIFIVLGVASILNVVLVLTLPETKEKALKDNLPDDNDDDDDEDVDDDVESKN